MDEIVEDIVPIGLREADKQSDNSEKTPSEETNCETNNVRIDFENKSECCAVQDVHNNESSSSNTIISADSEVLDETEEEVHKTMLNEDGNKESSETNKCEDENKEKDNETTLSEDKNKEKSNVELSEDDQESKEGENNYDPKDVQYVDGVAVYTDPKSGHQFKWDSEKNEWLPHSSATYSFEDDTHTYTDGDGSKFFWDKDRKAWFPKIDDDFMAKYQMNYGFTSNEPQDKPPEPETKPPEPPKPPPLEKGVKRKASEPTWFEPDDKQNTKVYVSNLPLDITEEEFSELMQKCGIIMRDPSSGTLKIKLYSEPDSKVLKGDALCTYIRIESVELALKLLDGYDIRGKKIQVERAKFQMRGDYNPKLKPKSKRRKDKDKLRKMQEQLFDWRPEKQRGERSKHERIVIVRNMFESKMFDEDVGLILEFRKDLTEECTKCGEVRKVVIFDRHPEGVAQINMKEPEQADACVLMLNGRWFGKRKLSAEIWDGKTKFKIAETDSQITQRLGNWEKFLEGDEAKSKSTVEPEKTT